MSSESSVTSCLLFEPTCYSELSVYKKVDLIAVASMTMSYLVVTEVDPIREEVVSSGAVVMSTDATSNSAGNVNRFIELRIDPELFRKVEEVVSEKTGGTLHHVTIVG